MNGDRNAKDIAPLVFAVAALVLALGFLLWAFGTLIDTGDDNDTGEMYRDCLDAGGSWYDASLNDGTVECRLPAP